MIIFEIIGAFFTYLPCYFKLYRRLKGGTWRYVICKYPAPVNGCWVHNQEAKWFECIGKEEIYAKS